MTFKPDNLQFQADRLKTRIKTAYRNDYFFDAAKFQAELEIIESKIKQNERTRG